MAPLRGGGTPTAIAVSALVLAVVALALSAVQLRRYFDLRDEARATAQREAVVAAESSAQSIDDLLQSIAVSVDDIATRLSSGNIDDDLELRLSDATSLPQPAEGCDVIPRGRSDLEAQLCAAARRIPVLNGIGVLFDPTVDTQTAYRPYANRIEGSLLLGELAPRDPLTTDWYQAAARGRGSWTDARFGATSQTLLAIYSAPFFGDDGQLRGAVIASYTLDQLTDDLRLLGVGATGYSIVIDHRGKLLSHPQRTLVSQSFAETDWQPTGMVETLLDRASQGPNDGGMVTGLEDDVTGAAAWLAYETVPSVAWTYGAVALERELLFRTEGQTRTLIVFWLSLLAATVLILVLVLRAYRATPMSLWVLSIATGLVALVGIGVVWQLTFTGPIARSTTTNTRDLSTVAPESVEADGRAITAGVFVQSVEFTGANDVTVSGIAWQQQRSLDDTSGPPGFVLPEADSASFVEQYRETTAGITRVGWAFTASLRQSFDYSRYPLDRETVWLRLWPADYATDAPLLPDLASYETLAPSTQPGIERDFVVEGWSLDGSSFSFRDNEYNTSFGPRDLAGTTNTELYFNIHLKRSFLDALMSELIPLAVVAILLFGVLLSTTEERVKGSHLGFSTLGVLAYCAALFFVVIVSHTELRSELRAQQVIYLEYFYFASYVAILAVSANAIMVGSGRGGRIISHRDNLIPSLLFWPVLNSALLVVTVIAFF